MVLYGLSWCFHYLSWLPWRFHGLLTDFRAIFIGFHGAVIVLS